MTDFSFSEELFGGTRRRFGIDEGLVIWYFPLQRVFWPNDPIRNKIAYMAVQMHDEKRERTAQTREAYQQNYQRDQEAVVYNAKYRDRWTKRISTWREFSLLHRLLRSQGQCRVLLDLPCGGGRLSPSMSRYADLLIESDIGLGQLRYGQMHGQVSAAQAWVLASGFQIPLKDASVDGTVCVRLNHHLPDNAEREQLDPAGQADGQRRHQRKQDRGGRQPHLVHAREPGGHHGAQQRLLHHHQGEGALPG